MSTAVQLPRGPRGSFLLGNLTEFRTKPLQLFTRCARDYGDFVPLRFGPTRMIFLGHPDYIEYVMVTNVRNFVKSAHLRVLEPLMGQGLVLSEGDFWQRQRRLIQPAFHWQRVAGYGDVIASFTDETIAAWRPGEVLDIHEEMRHLTLKNVTKTLFDAEGVQTEAMGRAFAEALEGLNHRITSLWLLVPDRVPTPNNLKIHRASSTVQRMVKEIIEQRRRGEDRGDLLSMLLNARDDDATGMTDQQVLDEAVTLFGAGHETTATALTWAFCLLSQHPEAEAKLAAEVREVLGGRAPTAADLPALKYAEMVMNETLRLYPPAPGLSREAVEDCEIGGYPVPKGTSLFLSMWTIHRDPRFFESPDEFRPDRWADGLAGRLPRFGYFPFGAGQRRCIAASFGLMEAVLVLASIVQRFHLELEPGQSIEPLVTPTIRPKYGLRMAIEAR